jgi:NADH dehydrogenase FAD-containing subunit
MRSQRSVEVLMSEVRDSDLSRRVVKLEHGEVEYDYLIVAAGASHAYFGHDEWEPFAPCLKIIEDALEIRRRVLLAFELAERQATSSHDKEREHAQLNFVMVGGGPTGVELAGTLADISHQVLANEFRSIEIPNEPVSCCSKEVRGFSPCILKISRATPKNNCATLAWRYRPRRWSRKWNWDRSISGNPSCRPP